MNRIPLIKPFFPPETSAKLAEVLESGQLTEGAVTRNFEQVCREYLGCKEAIAVCNCTVGLEVALRCLNIGHGDEVIVPDYTYPASASAVTIVGATAVLVDVDPHTMLISRTAVEGAITARTKAIMPVSLFGNPLDYRWLNELKHKRDLFIIEDAACSIGASVAGRKVGSFADISVFSMHPRKFITTGEGGLVTTDNRDWAGWIESYKHFGAATGDAARDKTIFERFGTNYKLSNLLAAVGLAQMTHINVLLGRRKELARRYRERLQDHPGISFPVVTADGEHSFQTFCVFIKSRDAVMMRLRNQGIEAQIGTYALHRHPAYQTSALLRHGSAFAGSDQAADETLALPLYHEMTHADQDRVISSLLAALL